METERVLSPIVFANIANKEIDEARKDEVRVFFMELTRTVGLGMAIPSWSLCCARPISLLDKEWVKKKLSICPFGTLMFGVWSGG